MDRNDGSLKIAIVGCGAICEFYYLPALKRHKNVMEQLKLVDIDEQRLRALEVAFGTRKGIKEYHDLLGEVDGVIVATPPSSHHRIAMDFLREGAHVLCEKPLAASACCLLLCAILEMAQEFDFRNSFVQAVASHDCNTIKLRKALRERECFGAR
jgi:predicted dinucleotide-utilizing enzyme